MGNVTPMSRFEHGGNVYAHPGALDFSANLNPLGMPHHVRQALIDAVDSFECYPDPSCSGLVERLSSYHGIPQEHIVCTAGASDLFQRICLALRPKRVLVTAPCFSGYEQVAEQCGAMLIRHQLREEDCFDVTMDFVDALSPDIDAVFVCSPNNPTGRLVSHEVLTALCQRAQEVGAWVVLDECFIELSDGESFAKKAAMYSNVVVARAFTKTFCLAGLRLGYGLFSSADAAQMVRSAGVEWAVSTPAQIAGAACLDEAASFVPRSAVYVRRQRETLQGGLTELGLHVVPGRANYVLFKSPIELFEPLLERGILIRRCQNYQGLGEGWYRVAVRTEEENQQLLAACREVLR